MAGALICLFLAAALFVALLAIAADRHRRMETGQHELQAQWLVEAALERAAAKLAREDDYRSEDWIVPAEQLDGRQAGRVTITVQPIADAVGRYTIQATARFPRDDLYRTQITKSIEFDKTRAER